MRGRTKTTKRLILYLYMSFFVGTSLVGAVQAGTHSRVAPQPRGRWVRKKGGQNRFFMIF